MPKIIFWADLYMRDQNESEMFNKFLNDFSRKPLFNAIIIAYKSKEHDKVVELTSSIVADENFSNEEKWLAIYIRRMANLKLVKNVKLYNEQLKYNEKIIEDRLMLNYYSILFFEPDKISYLTANSTSSTPEQEKPTKSELRAVTKANKKKKKYDKLITTADNHTENQQYAEAARVYQEAIDIGIQDWDISFRCLIAHFSAENYCKVLEIGGTIITAVSTETPSEENSILSYLTNIYCGNAQLEISTDASSADKAYAYYQSAAIYQGDEPLPELKRGLANIALVRMKHYFTPDTDGLNQQMIILFATEARRLYAELISEELARGREPAELLSDYGKLCEAAFYTGDYAESISCLKHILSIPSNSLEVYWQLRVFFYELKSLNKTSSRVELSLPSSADAAFFNSFVLSLIAYMHIKNKQLDLAVESYEAANRYHPLTELSRVNYDKAKLLQRAKSDKSALQEFSILQSSGAKVEEDPNTKKVIDKDTELTFKSCK